MKMVFMIGGIVVLVLVAGGGFWWYQQHRQSAPSPIVQAPITPTPTEEALAQWTDPAQFTFQYPKAVATNPHEEDKTNYSHVELTAADHPGSIIIWTKDTTAPTIDDWVKKEKQTAAIDTTLAGLPAKKTLGQKENSVFITTVRNGYLYQIEANLDDRSYWDPIFNKVTTSFAFAQEQTDQTAVTSDTSGADSAADDSTGDVEEETIQ